MPVDATPNPSPEKGSPGSRRVRPRLPHVVIVGAGFGGLSVARRLGDEACRVTVVDRTNHHNFQPLLYQVATAGLSPADIAVPVRSILGRHGNIDVLLAEVSGVDLEARRLLLADGDTLDYDLLVLAPGMTHAWFGHTEWARHAVGLKTLDEALKIRERVLMAFEKAERRSERHTVPSEATNAPCFVVVGAGPTGVEVAGALAELSRHTLARDFRHVRPEDARVLLVGAGPRLLETFPEDLSERARVAVEKLGVEVRLKAPVTRIDEDAVWIGEERIASDCTIWAAGVQGSPLGRGLGLPVDRMGRVFVEPDLSLPGHPEVFVIGDLAAARRGEGQWVPGVAPAAMQAGTQTAENVLRRIAGEPARPFVYVDKGSLATIGKARAVAAFGGFRFAGYFAWLLWVLVHIFYLITFRNRFLVMFQWAVAWFTWQRGARLVTRS